MAQILRYAFVLLYCLTSTNVMADTVEKIIDAYYQCGMSHYVPYAGAYIGLADEEKAALYLLEHSCSKEYETLKSELFDREKEDSKLPKDGLARLGLPDFSAATTLQGHQDYARDQIRYLFRIDRWTDCVRANADKYVRGTKESAEAILDASLLACGEEREQMKDIVAAIYFSKASEKFDQSIAIVRQRVSKYVLDQRLKQGASATP